MKIIKRVMLILVMIVAAGVSYTLFMGQSKAKNLQQPASSVNQIASQQGSQVSGGIKGAGNNNTHAKIVGPTLPHSTSKSTTEKSATASAHTINYGKELSSVVLHFDDRNRWFKSKEQLTDPLPSIEYVAGGTTAGKEHIQIQYHPGRPDMEKLQGYVFSLTNPDQYLKKQPDKWKVIEHKSNEMTEEWAPDQSSQWQVRKVLVTGNGVYRVTYKTDTILPNYLHYDIWRKNVLNVTVQ